FFRLSLSLTIFLFFFNDPATTDIYTLSLHDALPISFGSAQIMIANVTEAVPAIVTVDALQIGEAQYIWIIVVINTVLFLVVAGEDRKSTRLNSSHLGISYAVFCLKKKKK